MLRILGPVTAIAGLVLAVGGVSSVFTKTALDDHLAAAPMSLLLSASPGFSVRNHLSGDRADLDASSSQLEMPTT